MHKSSKENVKRGFASRSLVLRLFGQVLDGKRLDAALAEIDDLAEDMPFARLLLMQCLRLYHGAEPLALRFIERKPSRLDRLILIMGVVQLVFLELAPHAVVSETVALAPKKSRGFINAILRKIAHYWQNEEDQESVRNNAIAQNAPSWLINRMEKDWGANEALGILKTQASIPPLDLAFISPEACDKFLESQPFPAHKLPHGAVRLKTMPIADIAGFAEGQCWVQDAAAQLPVWLMRDHLKGKKVLDMCAAPGGKTAQILARGAEVVALDRDIKRMQRFNENMQRLGFAPRTVVADGENWEEERDFDVVFLDAPCSASGTIRRHPDMLFRDHDPRLHEAQQALFQQAIRLLKPGGVLVYSVCSIRPSEGSGLMARLAENLQPYDFSQADRESLVEVIRMDRLPDRPKHQIQTLPSDAESLGGMDGFFIAAYQV